MAEHDSHGVTGAEVLDGEIELCRGEGEVTALEKQNCLKEKVPWL